MHDETNDTRRPDGDHGAAGRNPKIRGCPLRPQASRNSFSRPRPEWSRCGSMAGRFSAGCGVLGQSFHRRRSCWPRGIGAPRKTITSFRRPSEENRPRSPRKSLGIRIDRQPVGREDFVCVYRRAVGYQLRCAPVPTSVSPTRFSPAQAAPPDRKRRPAIAGAYKKNSGEWPGMKPSTYGPWMRFTSSSMDPGAGCGFLLSRRIPYCCITQRGGTLVTSEPCDFGTVSFCIRGKRTNSTRRPSSSS